MSTTDSRFIIPLSAPMSFRGVGPFGAVRVEVIEQTPRIGTTPGTAAGYRFRPLVDSRAEGSTEPDPVWVELPGEWFAAAAEPTEAGASAVIEALLTIPPAAPLLTNAQAEALLDSILDGWARERGYTSAARCVGYVGDPEPLFNAEGLAMRASRSALWVAVRAAAAVPGAPAGHTEATIRAFAEQFRPVWPE